LHEKQAKARRDAMREWGRANGFQVAQFSKIPEAVVKAYEAAHVPKPTLDEAVHAELAHARASGKMDRIK
jgi:hypothetical protein